MLEQEVDKFMINTQGFMHSIDKQILSHDENSIVMVMKSVIINHPYILSSSPYSKTFMSQASPFTTVERP